MAQFPQKSFLCKKWQHFLKYGISYTFCDTSGRVINCVEIHPLGVMNSMIPFWKLESEGYTKIEFFNFLIREEEPITAFFQPFPAQSCSPTTPIFITFKLVDPGKHLTFISVHQGVHLKNYWSPFGFMKNC